MEADCRPEVKIIGSKTSLFCTRVECALKLKGVEYEYIFEENLLNKSQLLLESNPVYKKIPVLLHGDKTVCESLIILEYIDETWNHEGLPRLLPDDPYERAQARFWAKFIDEKVVLAVWKACKAEAGEEKEKAVEVALEYLTILEKQIEGKKLFRGDHVGYMDLAACWIMQWLVGDGVIEEVGGVKLLEPERFPSIHECTKNMNEFPVIKECLPPREAMVNKISSGIQYARSLAANKS